MIPLTRPPCQVTGSGRCDQPTTTCISAPAGVRHSAMCTQPGSPARLRPLPLRQSTTRAQSAEARRKRGGCCGSGDRSEEHTSELQSLMRISYAVFCLKKKTHNNNNHLITHNIYIQYGNKCKDSHTITQNAT